MGFGMKVGSGKIGKWASRLGINVDGVPFQIRAIHDGRYKYARYYDEGCQTEYEMYDIQNDPLELRNLAGDAGYVSLQKELADKLAQAELKEMAKPSPDWPKIKV